MRRHRHVSLEQIAENALVDYGFSPYISSAVESAVKHLKEAAPNKKDGIKDLRHLYWSSIDNIDSQDLDQLEYAERHPQGIIHIKVAIADVDHYVRRADAVDKHASHNATSLYTGVRNFPMLPERLSYDLTSLLPGKDRLVIVVEYNVKKDGQLVSGNVYRAWVTNKVKLVYEQVGAWLENPSQPQPPWLIDKELEEQIKMQYEASKRLRVYRQKEGMLEFETFESKPVVVEGQIKELTSLVSTPAHKIIEQFMIAANTTMVHFLTKHDLPTIQRIVRIPERWGRIVEIAEELGYHLAYDPDPIDLRRFLVLRQAKSPTTFADLSLMIIKLIGRGEYEMVNPGKLGHGHFGLAIGHYTHSTAPNRRYVDLIIQRLVKSAIEKQPVPYTKRELVELAAWCTERDTYSKKVERFMKKVAAAILLQKHIGEEFEGIITGSSSKGVYVRLFNPPAEGRIMRNERGLDVGQKVIVRLVDADPLKGFLDFVRISVFK